jgi:signal transduction histidine kinase
MQRTRELTSANQRLTSQWVRLQRANAFKSEILGTVAHDLKNPLSVILGRTEMLSELVATQSASTEKIQSQISHIRDSAKRLTGMVDTLIADAMADALDISIRREQVDLAHLVREIVNNGRPLAERKQQSLRVSAPEKLVVNGDVDRMREAIDNILSNAIKYTPVGGEIEVAVAGEGDEAVVRVRDTGPGLSPEDLSRLFGRFQRLSAKPTGGETSTGLGLSIAKRIVDLHGGRISAECTGSGAGTTFALVLPLDVSLRTA